MIIHVIPAAYDNNSGFNDRRWLRQQIYRTNKSYYKSQLS